MSEKIGTNISRAPGFAATGAQAELKPNHYHDTMASILKPRIRNGIPMSHFLTVANWIKLALRRDIFLRSVKVGLLVGTTLIAINHGTSCFRQTSIRISC